MLANNARPQIKRYNDIQNAKASRNVCRFLVMITSIAAGVLIVVGSIYLAKYLKRPKIPENSLVDDAKYYIYRNANKYLLAWSHTNKSQINGKPAYLEMLSGQKNLAILQAFIKKHHFSHVLAFAGSMQYSLSDYQASTIPYQSELTKFFDQFSTELGLLFYLNDEPQNFTNYDMTPYFGAAVNAFNARQLQSKRVSQIFFYQRPEDQGSIIKYLESAYLLKASLTNCEVIITANYDQIHQDLTVGRDLYSNLQVVYKCSDCSTFGQFASSAGVKVAVFEQGKNEFQRQASESTLRRNGFTNDVWHVLNTTSVPVEGRQQSLEYSQELIGQLDAGSPIFGFSSYLECFKSFYGMEPAESDEGYLIDLCRP